MNNIMEGLFWQFVYDRQEIFYKRMILKQPPPWTDDEILADAKFTNVYRCLDTGTKYVIEEILENEDRTPTTESAVMNILAYRFFNRIETFEDIFDIFSFYQTADRSIYDEITQVMTNRIEIIKESGKKLFTGSYISCYAPKLGGTTREHDIALALESFAARAKDIVELIETPKGTLRGLFYKIKEFKGFGDFVSFQCALDFGYGLKRFNGGSFAPFVEHDRWIKPGPGCIKGLELLEFKEPTKEQNAISYVKYLRDRQEEAFNEIGCDFRYIRNMFGHMIRLSMVDIEHSLCEFQKYIRMLSGSHIKSKREYKKTNNWKSNFQTIPVYGEWNEDI